ncbi:hypothetical protein OPV22_004577 [Ensete ventricosum]|uniref:Uncharacterized protein n=1 Tax=Ensete ventricosum TaxID=4639 RepID=A0AAV8RGK7_ENSVE|nr:hypothetical protein OPV22_004577 [Ensete ventricosum]
MRSSSSFYVLIPECAARTSKTIIVKWATTGAVAHVPSTATVKAGGVSWITQQSEKVADEWRRWRPAPGEAVIQSTR